MMVMQVQTPDMYLSCSFRSSPESNTSDKVESKQNGATALGLFHLIVPLLKCEISDMRDTIVNGLGYTNPAVFKYVQFINETDVTCKRMKL